MAKVDPLPSDDEQKKRREPKFIINPYDVRPKDDARVRQWSHTIISKHEYKFNTKVLNKKIIASGEVEPEAIDVMNLYPFPDLHWVIFRNDQEKECMWSIMLMSKHRCLFIDTFRKI